MSKTPQCCRNAITSTTKQLERFQYSCSPNILHRNTTVMQFWNSGYRSISSCTWSMTPFILELNSALKSLSYWCPSNVKGLLQGPSVPAKAHKSKGCGKALQRAAQRPENWQTRVLPLVPPCLTWTKQDLVCIRLTVLILYLNGQTSNKFIKIGLFRQIKCHFYCSFSLLCCHNSSEGGMHHCGWALPDRTACIRQNENICKDTQSRLAYYKNKPKHPATTLISIGMYKEKVTSHSINTEINVI